MSLQELTRTALGIIDLDELIARMSGGWTDEERALLDLAKRNNHLYEHYMALESKVNEVLNAKPIPDNLQWNAGLFYAQAILNREDDGK
jgi:hypothetical protein